jgi:hypothetical protein
MNINKLKEILGSIHEEWRAGMDAIRTESGVSYWIVLKFYM